MYLKFDTDKTENHFESTSAILEQLFRVWSKFYKMFQDGEIDEETYLLWQSKFPSFATANPDDMFGAEYKGDVSIDQKIMDAKKRFRKTKVDRK